MATITVRPPSFEDGLGVPIPVEIESGLEVVVESEEEFGSSWSQTTKEAAPALQVPRHPIPFMQAAFAESLVEATRASLPKPKFRVGDAKSRRDELLDQQRSEKPPGALWRRRPGQQQHELRRLMAQISFGVYLLLNGLANSQMSVVTILQGHIDEVDEFLETTLEDMALAVKDLDSRVDHLKLPLDNLGVFEKMLEDRSFRLQILEGNEKIEHIVDRTQAALLQIMEDVSEGFKVTQHFSDYLEEQKNELWRHERPDVTDIFGAMRGNTEGWYNALLELQTKEKKLNHLIAKLNSMVAQIEHKAGEVSRRTRFSIQPYSTPVQSPPPSPRHSRQTSRASTTSTATASTATATPPTSSRLPNSPPRLSLRLSSLVAKSPEDEGSYFDIPLPRGSVVHFPQQPLEASEPAAQEKIAAEEHHPEKSDEESDVVEETIDETIEEHEQDEQLEEEQEEDDESDDESDLPVFIAPIPPRNPRRVSQQPAPRLDVPEETKEEDFYLLQPRTYTPVPPAPMPSPRLVEESRPAVEKSPIQPVRAKLVEVEPSAEKARAEKARAEKAMMEKAAMEKARVEKAAMEKARMEKDAMEKATLEKARMEKARAEKASTVPRVKSTVPPVEGLILRADTFVPPTARSSTMAVPSITVGSPRDSGPQLFPKQRTSLRQRVSLKTTPPESIQVPPPNALELQRPRIPSPVDYQRDSAYGSDMERRRPAPSISSSISISLDDFPPPVFRPSLIPSPSSDQQYFRPVQASPHSPLQQRPHTSHTLAARHPSYHPHQRDTPSAMGMSMMSNVTTMTQDSSGGKTLKKKRSAFGWLKKAFALDDEERMAFEQKKREQTRNLYYDGKSPQFLDGRRVQPRQYYG